MSTVTDEQIIAGCRKGERAAQRELYVRTSDRIYRLLLKMTGNSDDAFDLSQEAYLRAFDRIRQFDGSSRLETWLYRIAINEGLQFLRRKRKGQEVLTHAQRTQPAEFPASETLDRRLDLATALDQLPPEERTIVVLKYYQEMNYADIARALNCPEGTVASALNRARGMLRAILRVQGSGESA